MAQFLFEGFRDSLLSSVRPKGRARGYPDRTGNGSNGEEKGASRPGDNSGGGFAPETGTETPGADHPGLDTEQGDIVNFFEAHPMATASLSCAVLCGAVAVVAYAIGRGSAPTPSMA